MTNNSNVLVKITPKETLNIPKYKSTFIIGNYEINNTKHFNWFNKLMFKIIFGITVKDIEEVDYDK